MIALLLKTSIALLIFLAFYKLFLERESFYTVNRWYLFICLVLAFVLPFISVPQLVANQGYVSEVISSIEPTKIVDNQTNLNIPKNDTREVILDKVKSQQTEVQEQTLEKTGTSSVAVASKPSLSLLDWILGIYFFGVIVFALHLLFQIVSICLKIVRSDDKIRDENAVIINHPSIKEPCSFFNYIFINPAQYDYETYEQILAHEHVHVDKKHSIDLLLAELVKVFLWFNPFVWSYRKSVEKNIEFQTDAILMNTETIQNDQYQLSLLKIATYTKPLTITTNYNQSLIKKRIVKMNSKKSNPHSYWKYSFLVPTVLVLLLFLNKPLTAATIDDAIEKIPVEDISSIKTPETEDFTQENFNSYGAESKPLTKEEADMSSDCARLLKAIEDNDIGKVKELLKSVDANCIDKNAGYIEQKIDKYTYRQRKPQTPLVAAARKGNTEIGKLLFGAGAKVDFHSKENEPPVLAAAKNGAVPFLKLLVDNGVEIDKTIQNYGTPLITASRAGKIEAVTYIHGQGADVNKSVTNVGTPLIGAARGGSTEVITFLLNKGADIDKHVMNVGSPLIYAARNNKIEAVKLLLSKGANINKQVKNVGNPLLYAARNGHIEVIKLLLNKGADIDKEIKNVGTPLLYAARNGHVDVIKLLLEKGADIDKEVDNVGTPLLYAARNRHVDVMKLLIAKGADINKEVDNVGTPLLYAARNGHVNVVKLLLNKGADIDQEVDNVGTPLLYAARNGHVQVIQFLLEEGADIDKEVDNVGTPLLYAARNGHINVMKLLLKEGANIDKEVANVGTPLLYAARNGHNNAIKLLLNKGADINKPVDNVGTPLIYAVRNEHVDVVKFLLQKGAKVDQDASNVGTALTKAVRSQNQEIAKLLLEAGADPYFVTRNNNYPMYYAVKNKDKEMQQLLEKYKK
ncbi:MAG: ankyrin repeat domain-containing protein [Bacteroidota bacterium]